MTKRLIHTVLRCCIFLAVLFPSPVNVRTIRPVEAVDPSYDVVIAGAGTGGTAAAIQAARMGSSVLLLEETDWVGGQMTAAGVSTIDDGHPRWGSGIYAEFMTRIKNHYNALSKSISTCYYQPSYCFEPSVGQTILQSMIADQPNITLLLRTRIVSVQKKNNAITSVILSGGSTVRTSILIDATEYGDLLPLAGVPYRSGNTISPSINPNACTQSITYLAIIKKYDVVPAGLTMTQPPPGYNRNDWVGSITNDGFTAKYPVSLYANLPAGFTFHNGFRGLPDSSRPGSYTHYDYDKITKTGLNSFNDVPVTARYIEDTAYRKTVNCQAKVKTLQMLYYLQHDLGHSDWSVANDEGFDTAYNREENTCPEIPGIFSTIVANMPPIPYVRESRRMIGGHTLIADEVKRIGTPPRGATPFPDAAAIGDYAMDLHLCNSGDAFESGLEDESDYTAHWLPVGPFQIPLRSLVNASVPNLIAAEKNISQSRMVNGATRLQPSTMLTGQAAGTLAALSVRTQTDPYRIDPLAVQQTLLKANTMLYPYTDVSPADPNFAPIQEAALRGIMTGYPDLTFKPADLMTRAGMAVVLSKAFTLEPISPAIPSFTDVPATHGAYPYIEAIYKAGITGGCATTPLKYCPDDPVPNAQMAIMLLRGWQRINPAVTTYSPASPSFTDVPATSGAYPYIEGLVKNGFIWKCGSAAFCPAADIPRALTANIVVKFLTFIGFEATPTPSSMTPTAPIASPTPTVTTPKAGDANGDNLVDEADYLIWKNHYKQAATGAANGDFNGDVVVDGKDYVVWMNNYGT